MRSILTIGDNTNNRLVLYRRQTEKANAILEYLKKAPNGLTVGETAAYTGFCMSTVSKHLTVLHALGKIGLRYAGNCKIYFYITQRHRIRSAK